MYRLTCLLLLTSLVSAAACATDDDPCAAAAAHIAACFPDHAVADQACEPAAAAAVANQSCAELAGLGGKADGWNCVWMPWMCIGSGGGSGGGGSSSDGKHVEVSIEECGGSAADGCPYVEAAGCALVTLQDADKKEVARGYTTSGGRLTFEGLAKGDYTASVKKRDGSYARMMASDYGSSTTKATATVTLDSGEAPWARINLVGGSAAAVNACAMPEGALTVTDHKGHLLDRAAQEWSWVVELESDGRIQRTRPLAINGTNEFSFDQIRPGSHTLRFVRMDIPSYAQRPNPDYEQLVRLYKASGVKAIETTVTVTAAQAGKTLKLTRKIVDPLAP